MRKKFAAVLCTVGALMAGITPAYAVTTTQAPVVNQITDQAVSAFGQALPILLAVSAAAIALAVAVYGVRLIHHAIRGGGKVKG